MAQHITWMPQPGSQEAFLANPCFELLYHGTRGPGKTDALLMDFAQEVGKGYGIAWRGILFRRTHPELAEIIVKSKKWFGELWPEPLAVYNESKYFWKWKSGEELHFSHFAHPDDYYKHHGHEYPWIGWEELTTWPDLIGYKRMQSCCRSTHPDVPRKIRSTTNPYGKGHNAVKLHFGLPGIDRLPSYHDYEFENPKTGEVTKSTLTRCAIAGSIYENKILLKSQPTYLAQIKEAARNASEEKAWLEGSWDIVAGGMFDDVWDPLVNIVKPFNIPQDWRIDRAFDWGSSKPFSVGWWAESDGSDVYLPGGDVRSTVRGDLFRIHEWYGWTGQANEGLRMLNVDITKGIIEREMMLRIHGHVSPGPADGSIFDVINGKSIAMDMARPIRVHNHMQPGIKFTRADKSSRVTGWEQTRNMVKQAQHPEGGGGRELPGLFVFEECEQFARTFPVLPRSDKNPDDVDSDTEDHIGDETRYRVRASLGRPMTGRTTGT